MRLCITGIATALHVPLIRMKSGGWDDGYVTIGEGDRDHAQACLIDQAGKLRKIVVCYRKTLTESAGQILHELGHLAVPGSFENEDMLMVWMAEAVKRLRGQVAYNCKNEMEGYGYPWRDDDDEKARYGIVANFGHWVRSEEYLEDYKKALRLRVLLPNGVPCILPVQ